MLVKIKLEAKHDFLLKKNNSFNHSLGIYNIVFIYKEKIDLNINFIVFIHQIRLL